MNEDDNQGRERKVGQRIASMIRSIAQGPGTPITGEEQQKLKAAADRLDQMLKDAADANQQALIDAAGRLDQMLTDIRKGKDVTNRLKRGGRQEPRR